MKGLPSPQRSRNQPNYLRQCSSVCRPFIAKTKILKDVEEPAISGRTKGGEFCRGLPIFDHLKAIPHYLPKFNLAERVRRGLRLVTQKARIMTHKRDKIMFVPVNHSVSGSLNQIRCG